MNNTLTSNTIENQQIEHSFPTKRSRFVSFDGGVSAEGELQRPDRYRYWNPGSTGGTSISRGAGLSYAAASFSAGGLSVEHGSFNRILDFDSREHIVEVETGIELSTLYDFLSKHELYLPIQPGHGRITVGGCIGVDVHGKNHAKDGTFMNQVVELTLFHPDHGTIQVSPENELDLFRLTCGGYGLTGHILKAKLRANVIPSHTVEINAVPFANISAGIDHLATQAFDLDFAYTWHNFMAKNSRFGHGYAFFAQFISDVENANKTEGHRSNSFTPQLSADQRIAWRVPLLNGWTTQALNFFYQVQQVSKGKVRHTDLRDALFPIHSTQFYFKLFGKAGFHEYQVLIPPEHIDAYVDAIRDYIRQYPIPITLASAKLFRGQQDLLRFSGNGVCLALNFPRTKETASFLVFLDNLLVSLKGIPNIIKDSRLPRTVVEACYPELERFRQQLNMFDPKHRFRSEISERLGL